MPRHKDRKGKCKIKIIPGPTGPTGPEGPPAVALTKRVLKVQLEAGLPAPNLIEGFKYEATVEPPDWPVTGDFIFFRAEVLDTPGYAMGESFSVVASLVYGDSVPITKNQLVISHYNHKLELLDYHSAVSEIVGTEDYMIAQSIQDAVVGHFFYVGISPDTTDLINFNHNLASLQTVPKERSFSIPGDLPIDVMPTTDNPKTAGQYVACVTADTGIYPFIYSGGGGGGGGGTTSNSGGGTFTLGRGGAGGNGGLCFSKVPNDFGQAPPALDVKAGDVIEWTLGSGGAGGTSGGDGQDGLSSCIMINNNLVPAVGSFLGINPIPGGKGGQSGDNGGSSSSAPDDSAAFNFLMGGTGGGGGAPLVDGAPGTPGDAGEINLPLNSLSSPKNFEGEDGGTNPRKGGAGASTGISQSSTGGTGGSTAGPNNRQGSGGGGGAIGSFVGGFFTPFPDGGSGSLPGEPANPGSDTIYTTYGGGGGGSAGLPSVGSTITGGNGGRSGDGSIFITADYPIL